MSPDREERGQDIQNRLERRFEDEPSDDSEGSEHGQSVEQVDRSERSEQDSSDSSSDSEQVQKDNRSEPSESSDRSESSERSERVQNVKEEWNGSYVYLPDELDEPLDGEFDRLVYECGRELDWKPKKNRHYYPVVIRHGIDTVSEMSPGEFQDAVRDLELL